MKTLYRHLGGLTGYIVLIVGIWLVSAPLFAAGLQVTPTYFSFKPDDQSHLLWLINSSDEPIQAQVRLFEWSQTLDEEVLQASQDFALSPAMVTVEPEGRQLVRVIRRPAAKPSEGQAEASYRLVVDELPLSDESLASGVNFVFRYSIPLFVRHAPTLPNPELRWGIQPADDGLILRISNDGKQHAQIADISLYGEQGETPVKRGLFGYVLAGNTREWRLNLEKPPSGGIERIKATINGERIEHSLTVRPAPD